MALLAVEGVYENGKVERKERPEGIKYARVIVIFMPDGLVTDEEAEQRRREARERLIARMEKGIDFGGQKFNREEIYEERMQELEERRNREK
ncbi:MAG TPA: hypothetical protein VFB21_18030 [Chthonomonadaceae bacterium]|nr:hypothetical protein [Chthonomonadaceae bacterium]